MTDTPVNTHMFARGFVRQDADGRWDWRVETLGGEHITSCLKQIGFDERPYRRKTAEKHVKRVIRAYEAQQRAEWQRVVMTDE